MKTIYKFTLEIGETILHLPKNAKPVHVQEQFGELQIWVELDPFSTDKIDRCFRVFGTGQTIDEFEGLKIEYIGTALMTGGAFVAHVYEGIAQ